MCEPMVSDVDPTASGHYIMTFGSVTDCDMTLWGNTLAPFRYSSSLTDTSSPRTVTFSIRTHWPTTQFQPTIHDSSHECDLMTALAKIVHFLMQTPSSITTLGPIVTLGPMRQCLPIVALRSTNTLPTMPFPWCSSWLFDCFNEFRYRDIPVRKSLGCPTSIQKPFSSKANKLWSEAIDGKTSVSIEVGLN